MALATEVSVYDGAIQTEDAEMPVLCAPLVNSQKLEGEFNAREESVLHIYPIAFSPIACSMQSSEPPNVYRSCARPRVARIERDNGLLEAVTFPSFQIYNTLKQLIRFHPQGFLASKSILTGATCKAASEGSQSHRIRRQGL